MQSKSFDPENFLPYLLNLAAEATSDALLSDDQSENNLTRPQWRVLASLGKFGAMTATDICRTSHIEKTKVSRSVAALEERGWLSRQASQADRRAEILSLTPAGKAAFDELGKRALAYDKDLRASLGGELSRSLGKTLRQLIDRLPPGQARDD